MKALVLVLIAAAIMFADTTVVTYGTRAASNYIPFWGNSYDACRLQTLWLQSEINTVGRIISFGFEMGATAATGTFNNFKFYLCHTSVSQLGTVFADNYGGNTPVLLIDSASFTVTGAANTWIEWPVGFNYNNTSNLLAEVTWRTDNGVGVTIWRTTESVPRRVYNMTDDQATSGTTGNQGYRLQLRIDRGVGVKEERPQMVAQPVARLTVAPNPVRLGTKTTLAVSNLNQAINTVSVYDMSGKLVRTLAVRNGQAVWTLRDSRNELVSSGVYFVRAGDLKGRITVIH